MVNATRSDVVRCVAYTITVRIHTSIIAPIVSLSAIIPLIVAVFNRCLDDIVNETIMIDKVIPAPTVLDSGITPRQCVAY